MKPHQYSLRGLLVVVTCVAIAFGLFTGVFRLLHYWLNYWLNYIRTVEPLR
jgi:hypothetical protein